MNPELSTIQTAAQNGNLDLLRQLHKDNAAVLSDPAFVQEMYADAIKNGHFPIVEWAFSIHLEANEWACYWASTRSLFLLQWLRAHNVPWNRHKCQYVAYMRDQPEIVQWIDQQND